jgi:ABC-type dipeptide/oligopeptide/nickel transport system ATPase component
VKILNDQIMETTVSHQPFNATQLHLLRMFSFTKTEQTLQDLKKLLRSFYIQQIEKEVDRYPINDQMLDEHLRTPYR